MVEILQDFEPFFGYSKTNISETGAFHYLRKLGVIDIGSNSVRMVIFDGAARSPAYFFNEFYAAWAQGWLTPENLTQKAN